jgi:hypothetical protein
MARVLTLDNCLDCPHHKVITSPYTGDSFDMGDVDVVCTLASGSHRGQHETLKGRPISVSDRYAKRSETTIPKWCPLPQGRARKKKT